MQNKTLSLLVALSLWACGDPTPGSNDTPPDMMIRPNQPNISAVNTSKSHNLGQNCMGCHQSGGPGKGWFNVAGTFYGLDGMPYTQGATLKLSTGPKGSGEVLLTVAIDQKGNFYTTEATPFPQKALFPSFFDNQGQLLAAMSFPTLSGSCNFCHAGRQRIVVRP